MFRLDAAFDALVVSPKFVAADAVGFNGQRHRKRMFSDLISAIPFDAIVETGTWLGNTTGYMAQTARRPIHSCEVNPRFHALAKMRLTDCEQVHLELSDSRAFLENLSRRDLAGKCVFFYLDAHGYDDLPLVGELGIIATHWGRFVGMIDDFRVPDDAGYGYDNYGNGKALTLELLRPVIDKHNLAVFFPAASSLEETGARRGSVVLTPKGELSQHLSSLASLRQCPT